MSVVKSSEDCCPLCRGTGDRAACTLPCSHRFCFSCIVRSMALKPECPVCSRTVTASWQLLRGDQLEELPQSPPTAAVGSAVACQPWGLYAGFVGGLPCSSWSFIFRERPALLQLLQPWLQQELRHLLGAEHSQVLPLEGKILSALPAVGLHAEHLAELLQAELQSHTMPFVHKLIGFTVERCRRAALVLLGVSCDAMEKLKEIPGEDICSDVFKRWQDRGPVAGASWAAYQDRWEGNLMGSISPEDFQEREQDKPTDSTSPFEHRGRWEREQAASSDSAAYHKGTPVPRAAPSNSPAPLAAGGVLGTSGTALQGHPSCPDSASAPTKGKQEMLLIKLKNATAALSRASQRRQRSCRGFRHPEQRAKSNLHPLAWAFCFRIRPGLLQLLRPWLRWQLGRILGTEHSLGLRLEETILSALPVLGLQEEHLGRLLRAALQSHTTKFVQDLISFTVALYGRKAQQLLRRGHCQLTRRLEESPGEAICLGLFGSWPRQRPMCSTSWLASKTQEVGNLVAKGTPVPTPAPSSSAGLEAISEVPGTSTTAPQGHPGCPSSVSTPMPGNQKELLTEQEEAAVGAPGPSQHKDCSCQGPQQPLKRKTTSSEGSAVPSKKP